MKAAVMYEDVDSFWAKQVINDFWPAIVRAAPRPDMIPDFKFPYSEAKSREHELDTQLELIELSAGGWGEWEPSEEEREAEKQSLRAAVAAMPTEELLAKYGRLRTLGCGGYGCVFPTKDPQVVFKVTTDATEAKFVAISRKKGFIYPGIARYYGVYQLPGLTNAEGHPVFILWREAAHAAGYDEIFDYMMAHSNVRARQLDQARDIVSDTLHIGRELFVLGYTCYRRGRNVEQMVERGYRHYLKGTGIYAEDSVTSTNYGYLLSELSKQFDKMEQNTFLSYMGAALRKLLENRMIVTDLNLGNVGLTDRSGIKWVIIDPGNAVPLTTKYHNINPEMLP